MNKPESAITAGSSYEILCIPAPKEEVSILITGAVPTLLIGPIVVSIPYGCTLSNISFDQNETEDS